MSSRRDLGSRSWLSPQKLWKSKCMDLKQATVKSAQDSQHILMGSNKFGHPVFHRVSRELDGEESW